MSNKNKNKRADAQDDRIQMIVSRRPIQLAQVRVDQVIEFQGQPMKIRAKRDAPEGNGLIQIKLSRAMKVPTSDKGVKVGRSKTDPYEAWRFSTRPIAGSIKVDRFILIPDLSQ